MFGKDRFRGVGAAGRGGAGERAGGDLRDPSPVEHHRGAVLLLLPGEGGFRLRRRVRGAGDRGAGTRAHDGDGRGLVARGGRDRAPRLDAVGAGRGRYGRSRSRQRDVRGVPAAGRDREVGGAGRFRVRRGDRHDRFGHAIARLLGSRPERTGDDGEQDGREEGRGRRGESRTWSSVTAYTDAISIHTVGDGALGIRSVGDRALGIPSVGAGPLGRGAVGICPADVFPGGRPGRF